MSLRKLITALIAGVPKEFHPREVARYVVEVARPDLLTDLLTELSAIHVQRANRQPAPVRTRKRVRERRDTKDWWIGTMSLDCAVNVGDGPFRLLAVIRSLCMSGNTLVTHTSSLATWVSRSVRTVQRWIRELEDGAFLTREYRRTHRDVLITLLTRTKRREPLRQPRAPGEEFTPMRLPRPTGGGGDQYLVDFGRLTRQIAARASAVMLPLPSARVRKNAGSTTLVDNVSSLRHGGRTLDIDKNLRGNLPPFGGSGGPPEPFTHPPGG